MNAFGLGLAIELPPPPPRGLDDGFAPRAELRCISERFADAQMHFPNPIRSRARDASSLCVWGRGSHCIGSKECQDTMGCFDFLGNPVPLRNLCHSCLSGTFWHLSQPYQVFKPQKRRAASRRGAFGAWLY